MNQKFCRPAVPKKGRRGALLIAGRRFALYAPKITRIVLFKHNRYRIEYFIYCILFQVLFIWIKKFILPFIHVVYFMLRNVFFLASMP